MQDQQEYYYRESETSKARFVARMKEVLIFHPMTPELQAATISKAWELIGLNHTEQFVRLACDHLQENFRKDKVVNCLREARYRAHDYISKQHELTRNDARGGLAAIVSDAPGMSRKDRAIFAYTRAWMRQRQDLKVGDPGCAEQMQAFNDGMRDHDPQWVEEWHAVATHKEG